MNFSEDWPAPVQFMAVFTSVSVIYAVLGVIGILVPVFEYSWLDTSVVVIVLFVALYLLWRIVRKAMDEERLK